MMQTHPIFGRSLIILLLWPLTHERQNVIHYLNIVLKTSRLKNDMCTLPMISNSQLPLPLMLLCLPLYSNLVSPVAYYFRNNKLA